MRTKPLSLLLAVVLPLWSGFSHSAVSEEEAKRLGITGTELTPVGAIRAGNSDGTIPEWTGGISEPVAGYQDGGFYPDPFPDEKPLFTITKDNYKEHLARLLPGNVAMFERYPDTYKMHVYESHRTAAYPKEIYERSIANATRVTRCPETNDRCFEGFVDGGGYPFPIPQDGMEAMLNHYVFYQGEHSQGKAAGLVVNANGSYIVNINDEKYLSPYWMAKDHPNRPTSDWFYRRGGVATICFGQVSLEPARFAGQVVAGCGYNTNAFLDAYIYVPGQRRVRKAPEVAFYDAPGGGGTSDGVRTSDAREGYLVTGNE
ncbi:MAG: DUF1329 domain-containing protein, partial [Gammaproteobacteria bacterium]|nr:DUF1329 domain-containing protein [Gammaproteobacteria bacterium]